MTRSFTLRYSSIFLLLALATGLAFALEGRTLPVAVGACLAAIFLAGRIVNSVAGAFLVLVSALLLDYFFIPPVNSFRVTAAGIILLVTYLAVAILVYMASAHRGPFTPSATKYNGPGLRWVCDAEGELLSVSASWTSFTGLAANASSGFQWLTRIHPADREEVNRLFRRNILGLNKTRCRILHDTGEYEPFTLTARYSSGGFGSTVIVTAIAAE